MPRGAASLLASNSLFHGSVGVKNFRELCQEQEIVYKVRCVGESQFHTTSPQRSEGGNKNPESVAVDAGDFTQINDEPLDTCAEKARHLVFEERVFGLAEEVAFQCQDDNISAHCLTDIHF